jgi:spermidine/putrescine transport system substrate-binding protein
MDPEGPEPMPTPENPNPISRRRFLSTTGAFGAGTVVGGAAFLTACGSSAKPAALSTTSSAAPVTTAATTTAAATTAAPTTAGATASSAAPAESTTTAPATTTTASSTEVTVSEPATKPTGKLEFANWQLYIGDDKEPKKTPTISGFIKKYGVDVNYQPVIDDNDTFTTKYQPDLEKGNAIGFDLVVLTSWMASRWIKKGWAQKFDAANFPNKKNVLSRLADETWDPGRASSIPWAIGQTAIAYYPKKTGFKITSVEQLFDPKLKGRVTFLSEMRDTVGLIMLAMGKDPSKPVMADALAAVARVDQARKSGQLRAIKGNNYTEDLGLGDIWACIAWSGDVAALQADHPDLEWVIPDAGAMSFVDNAMIPIGAKNKPAAEAFLNYVYDPAVAGPLYELIQYVPPVRGAGDKMTPDGAKNALVNPPPEVKLYEFGDLSEGDAAQLESAFAKASAG